jgi:hypothetical protein
MRLDVLTPGIVSGSRAQAIEDMDGLLCLCRSSLHHTYAATASASGQNMFVSSVEGGKKPHTPTSRLQAQQ